MGANSILTERMKDRTRVILEHSVADFIKTGIPITSECLYERHGFGIRPAMIRLELGLLSNDGYFYKQHPSGGRFPTDKAYRFFADRFLGENHKNSAARDTAVQTLAEKFAYGERKQFIEDVAQHMHVLGVGFDANSHEIFESGLENLLSNIDSDEKITLLDVVRDFEELPKRLLATQFWQNNDSWPQVFIGESPITRSNQLSVVAGSIGKKQDSFMVMIVGPKRMDYRRSIRLLSVLRDTLLIL